MGANMKSTKEAYHQITGNTEEEEEADHKVTGKTMMTKEEEAYRQVIL